MSSIAEKAPKPYLVQKEVYASVRKIGKTYLDSKNIPIPALQDITFDLFRGEFLSVVGPSGCGKSTLLKCIAGLSSVSSGAIDVEGQRVREPPLNMGIVFQRDVLLDWLNVLNNVLLPARYAHDSKKETSINRAKMLLEALGLVGFEQRFPWELSGGMRQRVSICRALLRDPGLLLMDEPFGALDALTRDELNLELQRIWLANNKTVLFITHSIQEAVFLSDRILVMSRSPGRILETIDIDLPRPRSLAIRETTHFGRYSAHIREIFERTGILRRPT